MEAPAVVLVHTLSLGNTWFRICSSVRGSLSKRFALEHAAGHAVLVQRGLFVRTSGRRFRPSFRVRSRESPLYRCSARHAAECRWHASRYPRPEILVRVHAIHLTRR